MNGTDTRAVVLHPCVVDGRNWWRVTWWLYNGGEMQVRCMNREDALLFLEQRG